ncbi:putative ethyl tert-butyl ether degradation protein [Ilyonectria robusta]
MPAAVSVFYPRTADSTFDVEYYKTTYMPKCQRVFGPQGMKGYRIVTLTPESPYSVHCVMYWESGEHFDEAMDHGGHELDDEIRKFSNKMPITCFGDIAFTNLE